MAQNGGQCAVVVTHDGKALLERGSVVTCCFAFVEVVDKRKVRIEQLIGLLHSAYAPIYIGRIAILQVILRRNITTGNKGLMAHQHTIGKTAPREAFGGT